MTPRDCRLTHINWIEKLLPEVSPTTLKEHVGHAAEGVTQVNYTRPITPAQEILRAGIERLIVPRKTNKGAKDVLLGAHSRLTGVPAPLNARRDPHTRERVRV
jgi:hypothetical protein